MQNMPNSEQVFRAEENETLTDIPITKEMVEQEINTLKRFKPPDSDEVPVLWRQAYVVPHN